MWDRLTVRTCYGHAERPYFAVRREADDIQTECDTAVRQEYRSLFQRDPSDVRAVRVYAVGSAHRVQCGIVEGRKSRCEVCI